VAQLQNQLNKLDMKNPSFLPTLEKHLGILDLYLQSDLSSKLCEDFMVNFLDILFKIKRLLNNARYFQESSILLINLQKTSAQQEYASYIGQLPPLILAMKRPFAIFLSLIGKVTVYSKSHSIFDLLVKMYFDNDNFKYVVQFYIQLVFCELMVHFDRNAQADFSPDSFHVTNNQKVFDYFDGIFKVCNYYLALSSSKLNLSFVRKLISTLSFLFKVSF